jgi:hypothetical protein
MTGTSGEAPPPLALRPMRFGGERRFALGLSHDAGETAEDFIARAERQSELARGGGAALAYGFVAARSADRVFGALGWASLGAAPLLVRPLRLFGKVPLVAPFGRSRRSGFREIAVKEPRVTRLWDRFSVDVGVAVERTASFVDRRVFERLDRGYRVFIFEDGDRYAIRAMCIFTVERRAHEARGHVVELLHDRSVTGMRAASHLLGLALREMSDAGADSARAWSLPHSGSYPIYVRHAFLAPPQRLRAEGVSFGVRAFDPDLEDAITARDRWYLSCLDFAED